MYVSAVPDLSLCFGEDLIQPIISLEMHLPSQGHYGFPSFPVVD
jgi:hypothetical protein